MTKDQFARLERHRKVKQRVSDWQAAVDAVPAFKEVTAAYLTKLQLLDGTARKRPLVSQGATAANQLAAEALVTRVVKAANALWLLYRKEKNGEAAGKLHRNLSDYRSMQDLAFATEALRISAQLTARIADLKNYNLIPADAATLATDAQAFDDSLEKPQLAIDDQKIKGANAGATLRELNRYLKDDFRAGLELLKDTHPDAYQALREASQVDDPGYRKRKAERMVGRAGQSDIAGNGPNGTA
ncbi:MAG: hypothetical protein H7330_08690 [Hymenobacteraceae bacterium]|nr:hypothetical protein [Hymenobacteraceae bacterium]